MSSFHGTFTLFRIALWRDRFRLPLWITGALIVAGASTAANADLLNTVTERTQYALSSAPSIMARLLGGPMWGTDLGSIVMMENFLWVSLVIAFMSASTVIRHTRQNEEAGRSELIRATTVGHNAPLAAALLLAVGSSIITGILLPLTLKIAANGLPPDGIWAYGAASAGIGIFFGAFATIAAQLVIGARTANGISATVIGAMFLLRGIGDVLGKVNSTGVQVESSWLTWLSPFGWGHLMRPFFDNQWWILGLYIICAVLFYLTATVLVDKRDDGAGIFTARHGLAHARRYLLSAWGLAIRLQRGVFIGWLLTLCILGFILGIASNEFLDMFKDSPDMRMFFALASNDKFIRSMFAAFLIYLSIVLTGYIAQVMSRLRSEEASTINLLLATNVGRTQWVLSHTFVATAGLSIIMIASGVSMAIGYGLSTGNTAEIWGIVYGAAVQIPALLVVVGLLIFVFACLPRTLAVVGWFTLIFLIFIKQLGPLLKLPRWLIDISPISHIPAVPAVSADPVPLVWLLVVALSFAAVGLIFFRRRDVGR